MRVKVTSEGCGNTTRVVDAETGEALEGVVSLRIGTIRSGDAPVSVEIGLEGTPLELVAECGLRRAPPVPAIPGAAEDRIRLLGMWSRQDPEELAFDQHYADKCARIAGYAGWDSVPAGTGTGIRELFDGDPEEGE